MVKPVYLSFHKTENNIIFKMIKPSIRQVSFSEPEVGLGDKSIYHDISYIDDIK